MNFTITVPKGSTNHGNPQLICTPPKATDYIVFFLSNYFAHAASVVLKPGQSLRSRIFTIIFALILPGNSIFRAVSAILRHVFMRSKNPLKRAARADALCMVVRRPEFGQSGDLSRGAGVVTDNDLEIAITGPETSTSVAKVSHQLSDIITGDAAADVSRRGIQNKSSKNQEDSTSWVPPGDRFSVPVPYDASIHGVQIPDREKFDKDFDIVIVPPIVLQLAFKPSKEAAGSREDIHSSVIPTPPRKILTAIVGIIQAIWGAITIYRSRGDQIQQYGYAAFGLTVAPYVVMSIMNASANLFVPEYPSTFMIGTSALEDAKNEGLIHFTQVILFEDEKLEQEATKPCLLLRAMTKFDDHLLDIPSNWSILDLYAIQGPIIDAKSDDHRLDLLSNWSILDFYAIKGRIIDGRQSWIKRRYRAKPLLILLLFGLSFSLIPLAIVGGISRFHEGNSTQLERAFTMSWLAVGVVYGTTLGDLDQLIVRRAARSGFWGYVGPLYYIVTTGVPAIGGMVVVGKMIRDFGICTLIS